MSRRRRFVRNNYHVAGRTPGTNTSRRTVTGAIAPGTDRNTRTLYVQNITDIQQGVNANINSRDRNICNLRGWKICMEVRCKGTVQAPMYFHWAIITPRNDNQITTGITSPDFFRDPGQTERQIDFSNQLESIEFHCNNINMDKYGIIRHKRVVIQPAGTATVRNEFGSNMYIKDIWIPYKRQLLFNENNTPKCTTPIFFVYWFAEAEKPSATAAQVGVLTMGYKVITYFRNSVN